MRCTWLCSLKPGVTTTHGDYGWFVTGEEMVLMRVAHQSTPWRHAQAGGVYTGARRGVKRVETGWVADTLGLAC
jgi:hypothetical protein